MGTELLVVSWWHDLKIILLSTKFGKQLCSSLAEEH